MADTATADALQQLLHDHLGDGFVLALVGCVGRGARDAALAALVDELDGRADLWRVDARSLDADDPVASLTEALGEIPDHPWILCLEGLEELARAGQAAPLLAGLDQGSVADRLPGLWVLCTGPESEPQLDEHAPGLAAAVATRLTAPWDAPTVRTTPGLMSEASPLRVALRPGAEGWVEGIRPALLPIVELAQSARLDDALDALHRLRVEADLEVALSPEVELLRAEIELETDRTEAAAERLKSVAREFAKAPSSDPVRARLAAVCRFDLAVSQRILDDPDATETLDRAEAEWAALDGTDSEMAALIQRERALHHADRGELRAALEGLEAAGRRLQRLRDRPDLDTVVALVHVAVALDERKTALHGIKGALRSLSKEPQPRQDRVLPLLLLSRGVILLREGDQRGASKALLSCVDGADALGPAAEGVRLRALTLLPALLIQEGRGDEALDQFEGVFSAIEEHGDVELLIEALLEGSNTAVELGELAVAGAWAREGLALALDRSGEPHDLLLAHAARAAGVAAWVLGENDVAKDLLGRADALYSGLVSDSAPLARSTRKLLARC